METKAKNHFTTALEKLNEAKQEFYRPEEDMVSFLICKNSQHAIENYLKGYLLNNGMETEDCNTIDQLYKQCLQINKNFDKVDLSNFTCNRQDLNSKYCTSVPKVINCFDAAENLDSFLRKEKII